ncbi:MAG: T9SS type A sorting domain-containing protein, partial [Bacteroidales bacterium]|nr:T9SS type A sorting domain-containing protein [Bacteroidales bacterium]
IRFKDDAQKWSSTLSQFFYKMPAQTAESHDLLAYEYWFDDDYENAITVNTPVQQQVAINELISAELLTNGIHVFNIRFKDDAQKWSSTLSQFFYKMPAQTAESHDLLAYEYWFDDDYVNAITVNTPIQQQVAINELISSELLTNGIHVFNIRFKDDAQKWSSTLSQFFYKMPAQAVTNNLITNYRYWVDDDFADVVNITLQNPVSQFNLIDNLDFTQISKGEHTINFQFKDSLSLWSSVTTDTITKMSLPISDFSYTAIVDCDSTIINYTDLSIDGDTYLWDFGDGATDTIANPTHTYYLPGWYDVSLTIVDTLTFVESTKQIPVLITGHTSNSFAVENCDSYTSPSGNYTFSTSGIYNDTIPNQWACDSVLTIDVTIYYSTPTIDIITACDTYTWIDGNTYTESNNTATYLLTNVHGCDSVVSLDLTINYSNSVTDQITACDTYAWIDGNTYTESNNTATYLLTNVHGCDSLVSLDLIINYSNTGIDEITACDTYTWIDGNTYTESNNTATYLLNNVHGCDSLVSLDLTINYSDAVTDEIIACDSYIWIDGNSYTENNNTATHTLANSFACDSIITLNLTINQTPDTSVTQDGITLTANASGVTYQWLDCDNNLEPLVGETSQSFTATVDGSYAVEVSENDCIGTSSCYTVTLEGIFQNTYETEILVYPNPTNGRLSVELGHVYPETTVTIYDINGKLINKFLFKNESILELYINEISGTYLIDLQSGNHKTLMKVVKH